MVYREVKELEKETAEDPVRVSTLKVRYKQSVRKSDKMIQVV